MPGLGAKPIIDIMAAVPDIDNTDGVSEALSTIGYRYLSDYEQFIPERRFFRKGFAEAVSHHLHIVEPATTFWTDHLLFRDFLRVHPIWRRQYEALKRVLASDIGNDRSAFTDAKTEFIGGVLVEAR